MQFPYDEVIETLNKAGFEAYYVGGCVRDTLLGIPPKDYDITTSATTKQVSNLFEEVIPVGIEFGTVGVLWHGDYIEITTFRSDGKYNDHRRPEQIYYAKTLKEDLSRRDFTINAMAYHPKLGIIDEFDGKKDLENRVVRAVGNPKERFEEDALRILRAYRFLCTKGLSQIEPKTEKAINECLPYLRYVSKDRILKEIKSIPTKDFSKLFPIWKYLFQMSEEDTWVFEKVSSNDFIILLAQLTQYLNEEDTRRILSEYPIKKVDINRIVDMHNNHNISIEGIVKMVREGVRIKTIEDYIKFAGYCVPEGLPQRPKDTGIDVKKFRERFSSNKDFIKLLNKEFATRVKNFLEEDGWT